MGDKVSQWSSLWHCEEGRAVVDSAELIKVWEGRVQLALWRGKSRCRADIVRCGETGCMVRLVDIGIE